MKNLNANDWRCAYIYCRVSTDEQAKHLTSIDQQEADARQLCADRAITIVEVFTDRGYTGGDRNRPELNRMLMLACGEDHLVDLVVACNMSRIARDLEFNVLVLKQLSRADGEMIFVNKACKNGQAGQLHQTRIYRKDEGAIVKAL